MAANSKRKLNTASFDIRKVGCHVIVQLLAFVAFVSLIIYSTEENLKNPIFWLQPIIIIVSECLFLYLIKKKNFEICGLLLSLFTGLVMVPVIIAFGSEMRATTPLYFAGVIMLMFFVLNLKKYWWIIPLVIYVNILLFAKVYVWDGGIDVEDDPKIFFVTCAMAFVFVAISIVVVFYLQEQRLNEARKSIDKSRETIKDAGAAKSRFLANMSHEIRTPMNSIIGLSELALKDEMQDSIRSEVTVIKQSAYDLLDIIDDVLIYSKLDSGKMHLNKVDFEFSKVVNSILSNATSVTNANDIKLRVRVDHDIPKIVNGDDIQIRQVLGRLLFISIQLTENGRIMVDLSCEKDETGKKAHFTCKVSDTGCGLSQADMDAIYGVYDTYNSRQNSNLKGIGLKFSICRELLKMMDGTIDIRSIEGVGLESTVKFALDIVDDSSLITIENDNLKTLIFFNDNRELGVWKDIMEGFKLMPDYVYSYFAFEKAVMDKKYDYVFVPEELYSKVSNIISNYHIEDITYVITGQEKSYGDFDKCRIVRHPITSLTLKEVLTNSWKVEDYVSKKEDETYDGSSAKVLVVDDNSVNLKVASGILKKYGIEADLAKSGEECLNKIENMAYHIIFMDMVMPEMNGEETLKRIRENYQNINNNIPVIALTASTGSNIREEILEMGFQEYIGKPIKQKYLLKALLDFLPPDIMKQVKSEETPKEVKVDLTQKENVLDTFKGLSNIGNNEDSYCAILNTYYSEGIRKIDELPKLLEVGDISLFTTNVHGIKSSSASIGAMTVSEMFKELEFDGKDNKVEEINKKYPIYVKSLEKILEDVKEYLITKEKFAYKEEKKEDFSEVELEELTVEMLKELKEFIDKMNLKECDRLVEDYSQRNFGDENNEHIANIKKAYEMFDFHAVKKELSLMLE